MSIDEIKELIRVVRETGIFELEVQRGEEKVRIQTSPASSHPEMTFPAAIPVPIATSHAIPIQPPPQATSEPPASVPPATSSQEEDKTVKVTSPIVGTYYDAPSPNAPAFVKVGDRIQPRQVLCIIESMKLMNEIEAEVAGTLVAKLVENGRPVEYGETLFLIRPV